jgi:hypothetical protein
MSDRSDQDEALLALVRQFQRVQHANTQEMHRVLRLLLEWLIINQGLGEDVAEGTRNGGERP